MRTVQHLIGQRPMWDGTQYEKHIVDEFTVWIHSLYGYEASDEHPIFNYILPVHIQATRSAIYWKVIQLRDQVLAMKLTVGLASALVSVAAASAQTAKVYMLPNPDNESSSSSSIPSSVARLIFTQRFNPLTPGLSTDSIPQDVDFRDTLLWLNQYGKEPQPLFSDETGGSSKQLLILLEGMTEDQLNDVGNTLAKRPSFTISDPPCIKEVDRWISEDFYRAGVVRSRDACPIEAAKNTSDKKCWSGDNLLLRYNVQKNPESLQDVSANFASALKDSLDVTLVLLPVCKPGSYDSSIHGPSEDLRRRQSEQPISSLQQSGQFKPSSSSSAHAFAGPGSVPACFSSQEKCEEATGSCSGRGDCVNKYAGSDGSAGSESCFTCHCLATKAESGSVTHWAGPACQKQDISIPFWLFAGFTLAMVAILSMAIGMLYSVGEEKLPGVIGAGVSKSK